MSVSTDLLDQLLFIMPLPEPAEKDPTSDDSLPASLAYLPQMGLPKIELVPVDKRTVRLSVPNTDLPPLLLSPREAELLMLLSEAALSREAKESPENAWRSYSFLARRLQPAKPVRCGYAIQLVHRLRQTGWLRHFIVSNRKLRAVRLKMYVPPKEIREEACLRGGA